MTPEEPAKSIDAKPSPALQWLFSAVVLTSSFLLFQVQPLLAKMLLPWFGGTAGVWTTCLMFFQLALLIGYLYAHWLSQRPRKVQIAIHTALLALSFVVLPLQPAQAWKPTGSESPIPELLGVLLATVGLPYIMLSATSPLLQSWYSRSSGTPLPWRFFALSNFGSLAGLLLYPLAVEPFLTNRQQSRSWSIGYVAFAALCIAAAFSLRARVALDQNTAEAAVTPTVPDRIWWFLLAMIPSALMIATTNHLTQNIAAVPFLWVPPLALYLLSLMACFDNDRWYRRGFYARLSVLALLAMTWGMAGLGNLTRSVPIAVLFFCTTLFVLFMTFHGELSRRKPHQAFLTTFYLVVAAGGAAGGIMVGLLAPLLFNAIYELPLLLFLGSVLLTTLLWKAGVPSRPTRKFFGSPWELCVVVGAAGILGLYLILRLAGSKYATGLDRFEPGAWTMAAAISLWLLFVSRRRNITRFARGAATVLTGMLAVFLGYQQVLQSRGAVERSRNFYAALMVTDSNRTQLGTLRELRNGTITHGDQVIGSTLELRRRPTSYYTRTSGIGIALDALMAQGPLVVGVIGLGVGTLTAFARPEDRYYLYEINPDVVRIASSRFTFLQDCPAPFEISIGDARISMERQSPKDFDLLVVDAFSGDSIPVHLLTEEAFALYWRHLKPDGVLAVHISNSYLDLKGVVGMAADRFSKSAINILAPARPELLQRVSSWVLVSSRPGFFESPTIVNVALPANPPPGQRLWTDDYSNLYQVLR